MGHNHPSITAHFGRQSGAVVLADAGIYVPNLKRAGRWALISAVEQCIEHSHVSKKETATAKKKVKNIKTRSENNWNAVDNDTEYSDGSNYCSSNNSNSDSDGSSMTDQITEKLPATMMNNKTNKSRTPQHQQLYVQLGYNDYGNKTS
eukprot:2740110-Ditylum_brightwellii.AAC.1